MNIYISIDGVLRNLIEKFKYHYVDFYLNSETESSDEDLVYGLDEKIYNDNLMFSFNFKSKDEYNEFLYLEFALEIFGHSNTSYHQSFPDLNDFIHNNKEHNIYVVGLDELGKSKPATLFFLSKNGFLGDNIKFISSKNIDKEWKNVDVWITDNINIIKSCPKGSTVIKFNTIYNEHFKNPLEINKLTEIKKTWFKFSEKTITSTLTQLMMRVKSLTLPMMKTVTK